MAYRHIVELFCAHPTLHCPDDEDEFVPTNFMDHLHVVDTEVL